VVLDPQSHPCRNSIPDAGLDLEQVLGDYERSLIRDALRRSGGVKKRAASLLGISFRSFRYRLEKLGLDGSDLDQ
jgi:two-component system response regulator PilR (NtrC family)